MYSLFLLSKLFHSTMNLSHIFSTIFPDKEKDDVLQKLSTKSILNSVKIIQTLKKNPMKRRGTATPGPLLTTIEGLVLRIIHIA